MNSFLTELSRRNVFRVAAAYVIVGWIVLQVVSVLMPALHLPEWMPSVAFTILLIGFPVAVLLTWAFELTPQGVQKIEAGAGTPAPSSKVLDLGLLVIAALLVAVTVLRPGGMPSELAVERDVSVASLEAPEPTETPEASIAVLAFANMSGNPENEYFSDGISEEILNALASVKSMRVAARTSAFSFKGKSEDVRVIGEALDVAHVLEGSVRRSGDSVRVTAQLINVASGYHLWSQTYDRELTNIFAIQEEIALAITQALKIELNIEERKEISRQGTDNMEAYSAYLKGMEKSRLADIFVAMSSRDFYRKAVELDPDFSDAWGALAASYAVLVPSQPLSSFEPDLVEAFSTALKLDPDDSGGLAAKAWHIVITEHDWARAGVLFRRALENDRDELAMRLYAQHFLYPLGRNTEAALSYKEAIRRDPLNNGLRGEAAFFNSFEFRNNKLALEQLDLLIAGGEEDGIFSCMRAAVLTLLDRGVEALEDLAGANESENPWALFFCTQANYHLNRLDRFNTNFAALRERAPDQSRNELVVDVMYGVIGDFELWLEAMNTSMESRHYLPTTARTFEHGFRDHVSDPRYQALLKSVRLDDASLAEMGMVWGEQEGAE